jgi:hypothetical protein
VTTIGRVVDVSSDQHPGGAPIDWPAVAGAGVTTALVKATQGTNYVNPWMTADVEGASAAGLEVRCYHFADFGLASEEAAWFLAHAGPYARILDLETSTNVAWARQFLNSLQAPASQLMAYGSASSFVGIYQQLPAMAWVAEYQALSPGWGVLWQFTDMARIPGIASFVDESKWQGSEIQYETFFGIYDPSPVLPGGTMFAPTPSGNGGWTCSSQGAIVTYGDAQYLGGPNTSLVNGEWDGPPNLIQGRVIVSFASHPTQQGYWCWDNVGDEYAYGAAPYLKVN